MRTAATSIYYLVGTPRGRLSKLEKNFLSLTGKPFKPARCTVPTLEPSSEAVAEAWKGGPAYFGGVSGPMADLSVPERMIATMAFSHTN